MRWAAPGSGHDRAMGFWRFVLPVAVGVLSALMVFMPLGGSGDVSFLLDKNAVEVARERLRLQSALYRGTDQQGRPFSIRAGSAVQRSSSEPVVRLEDLAAQIELADGPARLQAPHGRYDLNSEQVLIDGPVEFRAADGYSLSTSDARVDLRGRRLVSTAPVRGRVPQGVFSADHMSADLEGRVVRLDGNARLRITPRRAK